MKRIILFILVLTLSLSLIVGCQQKKEEEKSASPEKLVFVLDWSPNTNHTGIYLAQKLGYYQELGIELEIQSPPEDGAEALVASGKAQFGVSFQDVIAPAFAKDSPLPVTAVAALINHNTSGIISAKEKGIVSAKELENKKYATWGMPVEQAMMKNIMETKGADFSKLELVPSTVTDVLTAITTDIDAVWVFYAWDGIAAKVKKVDHNFFSFAEMNEVFAYYTPMLVANNDFLKNKPEVAKAFMAATEKGYQYAIKNPQKAADILLEFAPELDKEIVQASQDWLAKNYIADASRWGEFDSKRWNSFYAWLFENKLIEKEIPADFGFTNDFLPGK